MAGMQDQIQKLLEESIAVKQDLMRHHAETIARIAEATWSVLRRANQVLLCGNGGSAADAQHLAAELVNRFLYDRAALSAVALTTDTSILTAIGNDSDFSEVFARQVEAIGRPGDLLYAISTSGHSLNVIKAVESARRQEIRTVAFTGGDGGPLASACDLALVVPSHSTPRIQEAHITVGHIICQLVEAELFPRKGSAGEEAREETT